MGWSDKSLRACRGACGFCHKSRRAGHGICGFFCVSRSGEKGFQRFCHSLYNLRNWKRERNERPCQAAASEVQK